MKKRVILLMVLVSVLMAGSVFAEDVYKLENKRTGVALLLTHDAGKDKDSFILRTPGLCKNPVLLYGYKDNFSIVCFGVKDKRTIDLVIDRYSGTGQITFGGENTFNLTCKKIDRKF